MRIHARQFFALFEVLTGLYAGRGPLRRTSRNRAPSTSVGLRPPSCSGALLREALLIGPLPLLKLLPHCTSQRKTANFNFIDADRNSMLCARPVPARDPSPASPSALPPRCLRRTALALPTLALTLPSSPCVPRWDPTAERASHDLADSPFSGEPSDEAGRAWGSAPCATL